MYIKQLLLLQQTRVCMQQKKDNVIEIYVRETLSIIIFRHILQCDILCYGYFKQNKMSALRKHTFKRY